MPGRNPADAYEAFIRPIQEGVSCLGAAKILVTPGGRNTPDKSHAWTINNGVFKLSGGLEFSAQMHYHYYETGETGDERWRVKTDGYMYSIRKSGAEHLSYHWHPTVRIDFPHCHMGPAALTEASMITSKSHIPTGRISFEQVVQLLIRELKVVPARTDWEAVLTNHDATFRKYRHWHTSPA